MADVAKNNKSMSVVSSNNGLGNKSKVSGGDVVCSVQSNNGMIIDHNNKLMSCEDNEDNDDELILVNNTRNELESSTNEDKSLQELIESELALRICASAQSNDDTEGDEDIEESVNAPPEITKKIILEPRQVVNPVDVNAEFIVKEIDHYTLIGEPYEFSNGHVSPEQTNMDEREDFIEDEVFEAQTETSETEVTTTTSGPSLPSAYEANLELDSDNQLIDNEQQQQEEQVTISDSCDVATDDNSSNPQSVISAEKYLNEEELAQPSISVDEQLQKTDADELPHDDDNDDNELDSFKNDEKLQDHSDQDTNWSSSTFIENEIRDSHANLSPQNFEEETFDDQISQKEASGIDEKTCSFYSTDPETVDNDQSVDDLKHNDTSSIDIIVTHNDDSIYDRTTNECSEFYSQESHFENYLEKSKLEDSTKELAPLATPDEISDISNACDDSESRSEEVITSSSVVSSSTSTKKKKKIEAGAGSDASPNHTKTKKTKKSKKSELEKENISVKKKLKSKEAKSESMHTSSRRSSADMIDISAEDDLSNVNVKSLTQTYVEETTSRAEPGKPNKVVIATGVSIKQLKSSFNKFDALSKKSSGAVLHVRSVDAAKVQQQLNSVSQNGEANPSCRSCGKVVFQMEQTKAEGLCWHKNCFRCVQCSKQLTVDSYQSHEANLYCKPHFKELFQPKPVEESDQPVRPRKPELIIRENQPKELPPDVVRASDKPDLGLEELSALNVKSRFQVFEKANEQNNDIERSSSQVAVKRSPSILSKLAKFQAKGMDIGVTDDVLNGIPVEESSESEEEIEEEETEETEETMIIKSKRGNRERPISFTKMDDMKNRWETTSQQGKRESQREARKEEIAGIRSRLFMQGKQGKMKEMYQQAVADSERVTKINAAEEIQHTTNARSIKERFERGEPIGSTCDEEIEKNKVDKPDEEILAAGISRKSRSLFLELDATAAKAVRPVTPNSQQPKVPADAPRRARDAFMGRQVSDDVVRSTDTTEEVQVDVSDISNKFKFFESYREPERARKQFRITPPRDGQVKMDSPDREIYRDPEVIRADDRTEEVVRTDTARKMLSIFRQMEEKATKEDLPDGPKPLKRFTPPPEDKFAKATASESDEDEDEAEESDDEEHNPNYVRASDKVEDEFLKQARTAARAKTLRAKFEHWETSDEKIINQQQQQQAEMDIAQTDGTQPSIESASSLRARFESLGSQPTETPRTTKVKVNRFVEIQANCMDVCESCEKKVYPLEKVETNNKIFHKQCFRCLQCNCILRMDTFTLNNGKLYCIPHFKQLFITRGNYDEGFGVDPHKNKWSSSATTPQAASVALQNGDV
ncbi:xin actin-binding repeat-containing protein 2 isoform X10 [Phymastichus coffea]|uniref:xin actin-binding repeat-containing protein 2 isoform X10 n=1 Tax=Phymastichus coffea TaxID=108790 RepID=UPI00273B61F8|nr:xin actin-binding repeat-containing protein 2 isoform X10 [Phymastichus coffea]